VAISVAFTFMRRDFNTVGYTMFILKYISQIRSFVLRLDML